MATTCFHCALGVPIITPHTCVIGLTLYPHFPGGMRFSSEALRIRVARKVLASYGGHRDPDAPFVPDEASGAMSRGDAADDDDVMRFDDEDGEGGQQAPSEIMSFALQPPEHLMPSSEQQQRQWQWQGSRQEEEEVSAGIDDTMGDGEVVAGASAPMPDDAVVLLVAEEGEQEEEPEEGYAATEEAAAVPSTEQEAIEDAIMVADEEVSRMPLYGDDSGAGAYNDDQQAHDALMRSVLSEAEEALDLDDGHFLDYALDAMVASLEPPHAASIPRGGFTVAGWEIDRQLDGIILGLQGSGEEGGGSSSGGVNGLFGEAGRSSRPPSVAAARSGEVEGGSRGDVGATSADLAAVLDDLLEGLEDAPPAVVDRGASSAADGADIDDGWGSASELPHVEGTSSGGGGGGVSAEKAADGMAIDDLVDDLVGGLDQVPDRGLLVMGY